MKVPFIDLRKEFKSIEKNLKRKIMSVIEKGEFSYGQETENFAKNFALFTKTKYCVPTNSGTTSLMVALKAAGIKEGDEVITSVFTFIATVEAIVNIGAKPILVDIEEETFNLDLKQVEKAITNKTKAIIPVHLYGICVDMKKLFKIAKKNKLIIIEDAAHADGSLCWGKPAGSWGDLGCFSFYPSKTLGAYGNGGAVVTNNFLFFKKAEMIANHGRKNNKGEHHFLVGMTGTIDNLQAAVLNIKLKYLKKWIVKKRKIANKYTKAFKNLPLKTQKIPFFCEPSFYDYVIFTEKRNELADFLKKEGIETKIHYPYPLSLQPSLKFLGYKRGDFPVAEKVSSSVLSLPIFPQMTNNQINFVIRKVHQFFKDKRNL